MSHSEYPTEPESDREAHPPGGTEPEGDREAHPPGGSEASPETGRNQGDRARWVDLRAAGGEGEPVHMPDGSGPLTVTPLPQAPGSRAYRALVRFPAGWHRTGPGSYGVDEEFAVLEGEIEVNGTTFGPGDWVLVPAGTRRTTTTTRAGVLSVARFGGPPRWESGARGLTLELVWVSTGRVTAGLAGAPGALLRAEAGAGAVGDPTGRPTSTATPGAARTWLSSRVHAPAREWREILDLGRWRWAVVAPGEGPPAPAGPGPYVVRSQGAQGSQAAQGARGGEGPPEP